MKKMHTILTFLALLAWSVPSWAQDDLMLDDDPAVTEDPLTQSGQTTSATVEDVSSDGSLSHTIGIGVSGILAGAQGAELVFRANPQLTIVGLLGMSVTSPDQGDTVFGLVLAGGALYKVAEAGPASLHVGGRLDLGIASAGDTHAHFGIEVPLRAELAIADDLILHAETGLVLSFVPDSGSILGAGGAGSTNIRIGGQLLSMFGLDFMF